jgi:diketogulonate reductase-like aldo/keto reductase
MRENIDIFNFELSADDMTQIATLDTGKSLFFDHHDGEVTKMFMGWRGLV